jgi:tRNA(Ile)-lysidine synthase
MADDRSPQSRDAALVAGLRRRVTQYVTAGALLRPGERALLMLSGGADSMALLDLVRAADRRLGLGLRLTALHVDYATRGADSTRDRHIVEDACRADGLALHVVRLARKPGGAGFQERARRIRYDAAAEDVARDEADVVVTAHNRDDQAETVLYRLAKYASPASLRAMRPREGYLARPLLCAGAGEIRRYCRVLGIVYGEDESNAGVDYNRNLLRHDVLPVLARINPRVAETLAAAAELADDEHEVIAAALDAAWGRVARPPDGEQRRVAVDWVLDVNALAAEAPALRALCLRRLARAALGDAALIDRRVTTLLERLAAVTEGSATVSLARGFEAVREYDTLSVRRRAGRHACPPAALSPGSSTVFCGRRYRADLISGAVWEKATDEAWLGLEGLDPAPCVTLRHPRRGDRMRPFGMAADVLVSDLFTSLRVPREERARALVAEMYGRIAWVCPGRSSESFRVTAGTPYTLHISEEEM